MQRKPKIIYKGKSRFQNIVLLEAKDVRMYLDKQLQFSSLDERFYHEALVHPAMTMSTGRRHVLILGGGDGFAVREVLKYKDVKTVDLVELDPKIIKIAKRKPISTLNHRSLFDKRVKIHQMDAKLFFPTSKSYQVIIVDFPDPSDKVISKLYTKEFFQRVVKSLAPGGMIVIQSNSTEDMPRVYWSIHHTLRSIGMKTKSYFVYVPSFGDWGFQIASFKNFVPGRKKVPVPNQTLPKNIATLFKLPSEVLESKKDALPNSLKNLRLFKYYHADQKESVGR
ncbi:fused MFS/spermidine synthase [Paenibacillus andongensis]|uniref:fused MFS/spermidine synthase n=1 Tax=Paenibacillus andongensis TaxID=2975482 RepID=UPI0021BA6312|nr:fused MFS/spermidine synthase [Paenibacillus andongensis]